MTKGRKRAVWLAAGILAIVLAVTLLSNAGYRDQLFGWINRLPGGRYVGGGDKIGHFVLIGALSFALNLATRAHRLPFFPWPLTATLILLPLLLAEELYQGTLPTRWFEWEDFYAGALGAIVGGRVAWLWVRWGPGKETS